MNDQDEMFELGTETTAFLGCPQHMPTHLPGGFDGTEPGAPGATGVSPVAKGNGEAEGTPTGGTPVAPAEDVEALKKRGAKLKACNDLSRARIVDIAHLANECLLNTHHPDCYQPGQYGEDYRTFGKAFSEIRRLVKESIADVAPDYEMLALQFARNSFDFAKFQEALAAVASMKQEDFPGVYYTPGWLVELAKKLEAEQGEEVVVGSRSRTEDAKSSTVGLGLPTTANLERFRRHHSFCNGLFPIRRANCEKGVVEHCWIGGRRFTLELSQDIHDDGEHICCGKIRDNGELVVSVVVNRGKSTAARVAHDAFKSYVMNLSGSNRKYKGRGGFLKQAKKRAEDAAKAAGEVK